MPSIEPDNLPRQNNLIHVAAGVVENALGEILIAKRPDHLHQGGLWEFPGGKLESGEDVYHALKRELLEEVNLVINTAEPLIQIPWDYSDKTVLLDVMRVTAYSGEAMALESQEIKWVKKSALNSFDFPAANRGIVMALCLADSYMISGGFKDLAEFSSMLETQLKKGIKLFQLRASHLSSDELDMHILKAKALCSKYHAGLLVNTEISKARELGTGVHLNSERLMSCSERPLDNKHLVAASVHNEKELQHANRIGVDFIVLSPVKPTRSHPEASPLGWDRFRQLTAQSSVPVFALGGMSTDDIDTARTNGAQGIAAISCFWSENEEA